MRIADIQKLADSVEKLSKRFDAHEMRADVRIAAYGKGLTASQQKGLLNYGRKEEPKERKGKQSLEDLKKELAELTQEMQDQVMPPKSLINKVVSLMEKIKKLEGGL